MQSYRQEEIIWSIMAYFQLYWNESIVQCTFNITKTIQSEQITFQSLKQGEVLLAIA